MSGSRPVLLLMDFQHGIVERLGSQSVIAAADRAARPHARPASRCCSCAWPSGPATPRWPSPTPRSPPSRSRR